MRVLINVITRTPPLLFIIILPILLPDIYIVNSSTQRCNRIDLPFVDAFTDDSIEWNMGRKCRYAVQRSTKSIHLLPPERGILSFTGYKFTFRMNASHSKVGNESSVHSHTFEIALFASPLGEIFEKYDRFENQVELYLRRFSGNNMNMIPPFDTVSPTVENIGYVFFNELTDTLSEIGFRLERLDIKETPLRIFSISRNDWSEKESIQLKNSIENITRNHAEPYVISNETEPSIPEERNIVSDPVSPAVPPPTASFLHAKRKSELLYIAQAVMIILAGAIFMLLVRASDIYPLGMDIHGHLFKADLMFEEIQDGNVYPLFTQYWYNGVQPFRYWAPLPYYCVALLQFFSGGNIMNAYLLFIWLSFSVGGIGWILFGRKLNRPWIGLFFAILWFFLPDNMRVFFSEGNLPRMFIAMFLPYIFYALWQFVWHRKKKMIFPLILLMPFAILGHLMIAAMVGVACAIFLFTYAVINKRWTEPIQALAAMFFTFALSGVWLTPALMGGLTSMDTEATAKVMVLTTERLWVSLNPLLRLDGGIGTLYLGISIFLVSILGLLFSNRKSVPGFASFLLFVIGTATALAPIILALPMSQYFWVSRFIPITYAMFMLAVMEWKTIKRGVLLVLCIFIALDTVPSANLSHYNKVMNIPATHEAIEESMDRYLFSAAKTKTKQRVSLMDLSSLGPMPSFAFGTIEPKTPYVFGWAWQGAQTAMNIAYLNESFEKSNFLYMFDRSVELGADVILVDKKNLGTEPRRQALIEAGERVGYDLIEESDFTLLFSYPVDSGFGVITEYSCLAIGTTAALVPGILPYYHPGDKLYIDEYTYEELVSYEKIYLSGFFYRNRDDAEALVRKLADSGVHVFIDMSRIPADPLTNRMTFLDIDAQPITFTYSYPNLVTADRVIRPSPFAEDYDTWNTVYLNGLTHVSSYAWFENSPRLDFIGTGESRNIHFIGFNILFHAYVAEDENVKEILNQIMDLREDNLPKRQIVPISIEYEDRQITVHSEYDNVNTTLAYQDIFTSDQPIRSMNNFLIVDSGTTVIKMSYPHLKEGVLVMVFGIIAEGVTIFLIFRKSKKKPHKEEII